MNIVVLCGGTSTEREISIVSGTQVAKALREKGHRAILLDVFFGNETADLMEAFPETYDVDEAAAGSSTAIFRAPSRTGTAAIWVRT